LGKNQNLASPKTFDLLWLCILDIQGVHKVRVHFNRACLFKVHTDFMDTFCLKTRNLFTIPS